METYLKFDLLPEGVECEVYLIGGRNRLKEPTR